MQRRVAPPFLAVVLMLAVGVALVVSLSAGVPRASAYVLANGCDEYDPDRKITYRCTPDRSTFYTPDGINPNSVYPGMGALGDATINDNIGIPPPAPYVAGRDYCSNPPFAWSNFEGIWQRPCYNHDVCYGSQKGRLHCDVTLWKEMIGACKAHYSWYHPFRYWCFSDVVDWYLAIRAFGAGSYKPRQTSSEPRGE